MIPDAIYVTVYDPKWNTIACYYLGGGTRATVLKHHDVEAAIRKFGMFVARMRSTGKWVDQYTMPVSDEIMRSIACATRGVDLTNDKPIKFPIYIVFSKDGGFEGAFARKRDAEDYAHELRKCGAVGPYVSTREWSDWVTIPPPPSPNGDDPPTSP